MCVHLAINPVKNIAAATVSFLLVIIRCSKALHLKKTVLYYALIEKNQPNTQNLLTKYLRADKSLYSLIPCLSVRIKFTSQ